MEMIKRLPFFLILAAFASCTPEPEPINFGTDHCEYCKMTIADSKYGGELVTQKGKIYKFDAVECLIPFMKENASQQYAYIMAISYDEPGKLHDVQNLKFVQSPQFKSPMGANVAAFASGEKLQQEQAKVMNWESAKSEIEPVTQPGNAL